MRILWVTPKWPLPADDGARRATCDLLRAAAAAHDVTLLAVVAQGERAGEDEVRAGLGVQDASVVRRADGIGDGRIRRFARALLSAPTLPLSTGNYAAAGVRRAVSRWLAAREPFHATVIDGLHAAPAFFRLRGGSPGSFDAPDPRLGAIAYRAHNVESDLWAQSRDQSINLAMNPIERGLLADQAGRMRSLEGALVSTARSVWTVSEDDRARMQALFEMASDSQIESIPIGMDFGFEPPPPPPSGLRLLFLGRLDWPPNHDGLAWFLREAWPIATARRPDLRLLVAGSGDSRWLGRLLRSLAGRERITILGRVPDVAPLYAEASLALAPLFSGSGTRVKVLEAARFGRATLGTALGVAGLGLEGGRTYFGAEARDEFVDVLVKVTPAACAERGRRAREALRARFDSAVVAAQLRAALSALVPPPRVRLQILER